MPRTMAATERAATQRIRAELADVLRRVDLAAALLERWWAPQRPRMKVALAIAAVFAAASVLNLLGSGIARATAPRTILPAVAASHTVPALTLESPPADAGKAWAVVNVWQGAGGLETERFTVGDHWRVDWLFNPTQPSAQLQVFIYAQDGRLLLSVAANTHREGADTSFWAGPGTYFLKVNASGGDWKLDVQDLR